MPQPAGVIDNWDAAGNDARFVWFEAAASELSLLAKMEVETWSGPQPGFIIFPYESAKFPVAYHDDERTALGPFLQPVTTDSQVRRLVDETARDSGSVLIPFVELLTRRIHERVDHIVREKGDPMEPVRTLETGEGSCRDQVVLAMAMLRNMGIAARFVSGYRYIDDTASHDLHAWVEVYFPGGGWRGFDPTTGLPADERYVRISAGAVSESTLPVTGSFRGEAESALKTELQIRRIA
jgi:transglutaminase-like putative cysteine protease